MKRYFITGLLIWVPLGITAWALKFLISTMDQSLLLLPNSLHPETLVGVYIPGMGAVLTLLVVFLTGLADNQHYRAAVGGLLGRRTVAHPRGEVHLLWGQAG